MAEVLSRHQRFSIGGMNSVADTAVIEDAARRVDGVADVSACFLRSTVEVEYAASLSDDALYSASDEVEELMSDLGFVVRSSGSIAGGHSLANDDSVLSTAAESHNRAANAAKRNRRNLFLVLLFSFLLGFPVLYMALMNVFDLPRIQMFYGTAHLMINAMTQFTLTSLVVLLNSRFYKRGVKRLFSGKPSMDTLVMLGTGMALIYSIVGVYRMAYYWATGNPLMVEELFKHLYFDSACMILILLSAGQAIEAIAQLGTTSHISRLMRLAPHTAFVYHGDVPDEMYTRDVVVGDRILVEAGDHDRIPVDGVIVEGSAVIAEHAIVGTDLPVDKKEGAEVFAGTHILSGRIVMVARKVGSDTILAKLIRTVSEASSSRPERQKFIDKISAMFVPEVIAIAIIAGLAWVFLAASFEEGLKHFVSVLIISCPTALGLAVPVASMAGINRGAEEGVVIANARVLEDAAIVKTAIFSKSRILTSGEYRVNAVLLPDDTYIKLAEMNEAQREQVRDCIETACSVECGSTHPLAQAILDTAQDLDFNSMCAITYDGGSVSKMQEFGQKPGRGITAKCQDRICFVGNIRLMQDEGIDVPAKVHRHAELLSRNGSRPLFVAENKKFLGVIVIFEDINQTALRTVAELRHRGIKSVLLTGDDAHVAAAVAEEVGIEEVIANVRPDEKVAYVKRYAEAGRVAMIGENVSDAPALAAADVGIAISYSEDVALDAADVVIVGNDLMQVTSLHCLAEMSAVIVRRNIFWALLYNVLCIPIAAGALAWAGIDLTPIIAAAATGVGAVFVILNSLTLTHWKPRTCILGAKPEHCTPNIVDASLTTTTTTTTTGAITSEMLNNLDLVTIAVDGIENTLQQDLVKSVLQEKPGVYSVQIRIAAGIVRVYYSDETTAEELAQTIEKLSPAFSARVVLRESSDM